MNKYILVLVSILALSGFLWISYQATNKPVKIDFPQVSQISKDDHVKGKGTHILVEYADLQCPACRSFHEYLQSEREKDKNFDRVLNEKYTFVFRHFPLTHIHHHAQLAAQAAESAGIQGKFFEFLDAAFASQDTWSKLSETGSKEISSEAQKSPKDHFLTIAKDLGLDEETFKKDMDSETVKKRVAADVESGIKAELSSTPSFYLNGKKMMISTFEDLKKQILETAK